MLDSEASPKAFPGVKSLDWLLWQSRLALLVEIVLDFGAELNQNPSRWPFWDGFGGDPEEPQFQYFSLRVADSGAPRLA